MKLILTTILILFTFYLYGQDKLQLKRGDCILKLYFVTWTDGAIKHFTNVKVVNRRLYGHKTVHYDDSTIQYYIYKEKSDDSACNCYKTGDAKAKHDKVIADPKNYDVKLDSTLKIKFANNR